MSILQSALHSPFFSGGMALGIVGGTIAYLRRLPSQVWNGFLKLFTVTAEIPNTDYAFEWLQVWIAKQPASKRIRNLSVNTSMALQKTSTPDETLEDRRKQILLAPAVGNHILKYNRRYMWLSRQRNEGKDSGDGKKKTEYWHIRLFGRNQNIIRDLVSEAREAYREIYKRPLVMISARNYWESLNPIPERELNSVVLPGNTIAKLVLDIETFLKSKDWYALRSVPYRRGYMLQGPPGTGKSSLVIALAHYFSKPVYVINLGGMGISDDSLVELLCGVPIGAIVLLEDIDATTRSRTKKSKSDDGSEKVFVSLSGLLNALDGLVAKEGRILIMTTNHPEQLDPALVRPGRVDLTITFNYLTVEQGKELFTRFFSTTNGAEEFGNIVGGKSLTPAAIQEHLLQYRDNPIMALERAGELV